MKKINKFLFNPWRVELSKGFTLIELLVVIAIIGLLASVVIVALAGSRQKSRDAKRVADITQMSKAMELFFTQYSTYPTTASTCIIGVTAGCLGVLSPTIVNVLPAAPKPADPGCVGSLGAGIANDYQLVSTGGVNTVNSYAITFCVSAQTGSFSAGVHTLTDKGFQ